MVTCATAARMRAFEESGKMTLSAAMRDGATLFDSCRADASDMAGAMRWAYENAGQVIDPHSAIGLHAARRAEIADDVPVVTLATAHPAKFPEAVERATGIRPSLPQRLSSLFDREERYITLPGEYGAVRDHILATARPSCG